MIRVSAGQEATQVLVKNPLVLRRAFSNGSIMLNKKVTIQESTAKMISTNDNIAKHLRLVDSMKKYQPKQLGFEAPLPVLSKPLPISTELNYYAPLRNEITHGHLKAEVTFRCYDQRNMDFFCDFALRAAYYLGIPVTGPKPLPVRKERWTVIKAPFVHAKTKENFERHTKSRLIKVWDTNNEVIDYWLAYISENSVWGVGVKAHIYSNETLNFTNSIQKKSKTDKTITELQKTFKSLSNSTKKGIDIPELKENYQYKQLVENSADSPVSAKVQELLSNPIFAQYMNEPAEKEVKKEEKTSDVEVVPTTEKEIKMKKLWEVSDEN